MNIKELYFQKKKTKNEKSNNDVDYNINFLLM